MILSPSSINLYLSCPHSFYLRYVEKNQPVQIDDTPLRAGKSVHAILEHFYEEINIDAPDSVKEFNEKIRMTAFKYWDRTIDTKKRDEMELAIFGWLKFEIQRFESYKKQGIIDRFKPLAVEQDLTDYVNQVRAVVDKRCIGSSGLEYAMDYKTDKKAPTKKQFNGVLADIDMKFKVQAALNYIVLSAHGFQIHNFFFQFVRFPEKLLMVPLTAELFNEVNTLRQTIINDTKYEKNKKGCFMCNFKDYCETSGRSIHCL
jgi:CRISPR/Cas system-associated exonuclease Cas4 (RecB family)